RSILKHFRGQQGTPDPPTTGSTEAIGWDPVGASKTPQWQVVGFDRVDDIPRRQQQQQKPSALSPRNPSSPLFGGTSSIINAKWVEKRQMEQPAAVVSFHTLVGQQGGSRTGSLGGSDTLLAEEIARNRVCLASFGVPYTVVVVISRALAEAADTEARLATIMQLGGIEATQFAVCRPGSATQFQQFLGDLERRLFGRAAAYYADCFRRTQAKMLAIPQLPLPDHPSRPQTVRMALEFNEHAKVTTANVFAEPSLVDKYSRFMPLRAWLVRYHVKLALFAECAGDRDSAHRCSWVAYLHLAAFLGEIAAGAYLPPSKEPSDSDEGWLWPWNGGYANGRQVLVGGQLWDESMELLEALHVRVVRAWLYQSIVVARAKAAQTGGAWNPIGFAHGHVSAPVTALQRSRTSAVAASGVGVDGSVDALVMSVHAGEASAATERLMELERLRRGGLAREGVSWRIYFLALGSESADVDLAQPANSGSLQESPGWWPLSGVFGVVDMSRGGSGRLAARQGDSAGQLVLVANNSLELSGAATMVPPGLQYDTYLTMAARQCAEHILAHAMVLRLSNSSGRLWAWVARQYTCQAQIYRLASANGIDFGQALAQASPESTDTALTAAGLGRQLIDSLVASLRKPQQQLATAALLTAQTKESVQQQQQGQSGRMGWEKGRPRAPSSVLSGFAFDQALGGIYAVVDSKPTEPPRRAVGPG
ncbi:hypothetical protein FBU59_003012, partial [Linderina macrospora]